MTPHPLAHRPLPKRRCVQCGVRLHTKLVYVPRLGALHPHCAYGIRASLRRDLEWHHMPGAVR